MIDIPPTTIVEALKFRMEQMEWNQSQLAIALGMQRSHLSEVLNGKRKLSLRFIRRAWQMGVPAKVLLEDK